MTNKSNLPELYVAAEDAMFAAKKKEGVETLQQWSEAEMAYVEAYGTYGVQVSTKFSDQGYANVLHRCIAEALSHVRHNFTQFDMAK